MKKIDLKLIAKSVVDDFNNIYEVKKGIKIELIDNENLRNKVGTQGLHDLEKNYSYNAVKDLYLNILNSV